jgi:hypothetical protein
MVRLYQSQFKLWQKRLFNHLLMISNFSNITIRKGSYMENLRIEPNRDSASNRGDNSSRSERTNHSSEHAARRAGLRSLGINPNTWEQDAQRQRLVNETRNLPIDQQRARHQAWVDSLPQADQAQQNQWLINGEHAHLVLQTQNLPIDQQRARHQNWIDSLPQAYRTHHNEGVLDTERYHLGRQTRNLPIDQQRARHQAWIDSLPQALQAEQNQLVLDIERQRLVNETTNLPIDQQRPRHQAGVDSLPQVDHEQQDQMAIDRERERLVHQTRNLPIDQQRARHQAWVDSLPQADQAQQNQWLINGEHAHLVLQTIELPIDQQRAIHQNWIDSLPQAYRTHHNEGVLDTERYRLGRQTENLPLDQQRARHQAWIDSLPQADQAQQNQILLGGVDQQIQPIPQQLLEHFGQEDSDRQRHIERVEAIIQDQQLDIAVPNRYTPGWSDFAANLITEYESEELPLAKDKETGEIFKKDGSKPIINARGKQLGDDDIEILTDDDGNVRTEERGLGHCRLLGDILQGGTGQANSNERNSDEYKELMTWVLRKWRDHISERDRNNA